MVSPRLRAAALAIAAIAGPTAVGCGGSEPSGEPRPESDRGPAQSSTDQGQSSSDESERDGEDGENGQTSGQSSSVTQSSDGESSSQSSSVTQSSGSGSSRSSTSSRPGVKTFSGTGASELSFTVERPGRLSWTSAEGKAFSLRGTGVTADSSGGRGEVRLDPGRYDDVEVRGTDWVIVVRSR